MNPVWSHHGIVCTGEAYKKVVKLTFARGAWIPDPSRLFNSSLEGNTRGAARPPARSANRRVQVVELTERGEAAFHAMRGAATEFAAGCGRASPTRR